VFERIWQIKAFQRHFSYLKLLQTLVSTAIIVLESMRDPLPYSFFWRFYRILRWGPTPQLEEKFVFYWTFPFYWRYSSGHSLIIWTLIPFTHMYIHTRASPLLIQTSPGPHREHNVLYCSDSLCWNGNYFTVSLNSNNRLYSLHYSAFKPSCFSMRFDAKNGCAGEGKQQFNWLTDLPADRPSWLAYSKETNPSCHLRICYTKTVTISV
jgi:hypothetical protein